MFRHDLRRPGHVEGDRFGVDPTLGHLSVLRHDPAAAFPRGVALPLDLDVSVQPTRVVCEHADELLADLAGPADLGRDGRG